MTQENNGARLVQLLAAQMEPDAEIDGEKLVDALGLNSLQQQAFLKSVNDEFGVNITVDDIEAARGKGGLLSLIDNE